MCELIVATSIVEILEAKIQNKDFFTAFDVTQEVRKSLGKSNNVSHNDVRNIIINEFRTGQMPGYERDLCTLELPNSPQAFVYHPDDEEVSNYYLISKDDTNTDSNTDSNTVVDNDSDNVVTMTAAGRIDIPKKLLNQVNALGGSYDFSVGGTICPKIPDKNGRVRFSLNSLGISGGKAKVIVDVAHNKIDIESA